MKSSLTFLFLTDDWSRVRALRRLPAPVLVVIHHTVFPRQGVRFTEVQRCPLEPRDITSVHEHVASVIKFHAKPDEARAGMVNKITVFSTVLNTLSNTVKHYHVSHYRVTTILLPFPRTPGVFTDVQ